MSDEKSDGSVKREAKNATPTELILSSSNEGMYALDSHCNEFESIVRKAFEASSSYGLQHINSLGAAHPDTLDRMPNSGLLRLAAQCMDRLARRIAAQGEEEFLGPKSHKSAYDFEEAEKCLSLLKKWGAKRVDRVSEILEPERVARDLAERRANLETLASALNVDIASIPDKEGNSILAQIETEEAALRA